MCKNPYAAWKWLAVRTRHVINGGVILERFASQHTSAKERSCLFFFAKRNYRRSLSLKRLYTSIQAISFQARWQASLSTCLSARALLSCLSFPPRLDSIAFSWCRIRVKGVCHSRRHTGSREKGTLDRALSIFEPAVIKNRDKTVRARARIESVLRLSRLVLSLASTINRSFRNRLFLLFVSSLSDRMQQGSILSQILTDRYPFRLSRDCIYSLLLLITRCAYFETYIYIVIGQS